jgi:hypothetical protein
MGSVLHAQNARIGGEDIPADVFRRRRHERPQWIDSTPRAP